MKLPLFSGRELIATLQKLGFKAIRQRGSHVFLKHEDGRTTTVPVHQGDKIDRGLLNKIIKKDLGITIEEFMRKL